MLTDRGLCRSRTITYGVFYLKGMSKFIETITNCNPKKKNLFHSKMGNNLSLHVKVLLLIIIEVCV